MSEEITVKVKQSVTSSSQNPTINTPHDDPILTGFFRLNPTEITNTDRSKLSEINDYLSDSENEMDKVMRLKDIRYRLGHPKMGVSELEHVHKYIRIRNSIARQEAQAKALER